VRIEAIRDGVDASDAAPEAVIWLNATLSSNAGPATVRDYLLAAQKALEATDDPELTRAAEELSEIIQAIRLYDFEPTATLYPISTVEWLSSGDADEP
jgi:hypothetical protein